MKATCPVHAKTFAIIVGFILLTTIYCVSNSTCKAQEPNSDVLGGKVRPGQPTPQGSEPQAPALERKPKPEESLETLASIANKLTGHWQVTATSGKSMYHSWRSGPRGLSLTRETVGQSADGKPWREVMVFYWHSQRKKICVFGLSSFSGGVTEGTLQFDGKTIRNEYSLFQNGGRHRKMAQEWVTLSPGKLREVLYEDTGSEGYKPLVEFDNIRILSPPQSATSQKGDLGADSKLPQPLLSLLVSNWSAPGFRNPENYRHLSFEWIPHADVVHAKIIEFRPTGQMLVTGDTYIYRHPATHRLQFMKIEPNSFLDSNGFEGDVRLWHETNELVDDNIVENADENENQNTKYELALVQNADGTLQHELWSIKGHEREMMFSTRFSKLPRP